LIGQLRSLEVIPQKIEHLFTTLGDPWQIELRRFPIEIKNNFNLVTSSHDFKLLFEYFKTVERYSNKRESYMELLSEAQSELMKNHTQCKCNWGRRKDGYYNHWVRVDPDQWPHWCCICPYEVAIEELEFGWGQTEKGLSRRQVQDERMNFILHSKKYHDAGFIGYTAEANVSDDGQLYLYPQVWPCCEWIDNFKLGNLLNAIAEFQIELAYDSLILWLNNIEDGDRPDNRNDPSCCLFLCETEEGLTLIKWTRKI
jgi:hypothetical protein